MAHLRTLLRAMAVVATAAGADAVLRGTGSVPHAPAVAPSVDSEFRFYAAWYAAAGTLLWRAADAPERSTAVIRTASAALLAGAAGRVASWRALGPPSRFHQGLLGVEVALGIAVPVAHRQALSRVVGRGGSR